MSAISPSVEPCSLSIRNRRDGAMYMHDASSRKFGFYLFGGQMRTANASRDSTSDAPFPRMHRRRK